MTTKVTSSVLDSQAARIDVKDAGSLIVNTNDINFIDGTGITVTVADNGGQADITIAGFDGAYGSLSGAPTNVSSFTNDAGYITATLTDEQVCDIVGAMVSGNTETGITVTYQDSDNTLDFVVNFPVPTTITVADTTDTTCNVALFESATGDLAPKTDSGITYNASTGVLTATGFAGPLTGNASTATALQNARTIGGVSFNGTANIVPQTIQSVNESSDTTCFLLFITAAGTQSLQPMNNTSLTFNASTGALGSTTVLSGGNLVKTVGKETLWIPANAMTPAAVSGAQTGTVTTTTNALNFDVLDFDTSADEFAWFTVALPKQWNNGTVTFKAYWLCEQTSGTVEWNLDGRAFGDSDALDTAVGTAGAVSDTALSPAGDLMVSSESSAITIAGSPAAEDLCIFRVWRDVSDDTMSSDARLIGIKLYYTTNASNDA